MRVMALRTSSFSHVIVNHIGCYRFIVMTLQADLLPCSKQFVIGGCIMGSMTCVTMSTDHRAMLGTTGGFHFDVVTVVTTPAFQHKVVLTAMGGMALSAILITYLLMFLIGKDVVLYMALKANVLPWPFQQFRSFGKMGIMTFHTMA